EGFTINGRPHPCDLPGEENWLVDFCYDHTGGRRKPVSVICHPTFFEVTGDNNQFGLYEYRGMVQAAARELMSLWKVSWVAHPDARDEESDAWNVGLWATKQTCRGIGQRF